MSNQPEKAKNPIIEFLVNCIAGGSAGAFSKTVAAPLERTKLLLQTQDANKKLDGKKYTGKIPLKRLKY